MLKIKTLINDYNYSMKEVDKMIRDNFGKLKVKGNRKVKFIKFACHFFIE